MLKERCQFCGRPLRSDNKSGYCSSCQRRDWPERGCPVRMTRDEHIRLRELVNMMKNNCR